VTAWPPCALRIAITASSLRFIMSTSVSSTEIGVFDRRLSTLSDRTGFTIW
jgi:hypothetical protein